MHRFTRAGREGQLGFFLFVSIFIVLLVTQGSNLLAAWVINENNIKITHQHPINRIAVEKIAPQYPQARWLLGTAAYRLGNFSQSTGWFESLSSFSARKPLVYWWLGEISLARGENGKAVTYFREAKAAPYFIHQCISLSDTAVVQADRTLDMAVSACKFALQVSGSDKVVAQNLARLYALSGDFVESGKYYLRAAAVEEDPFVRNVLLGHGYQLLGQWETAASAYQAAIEIKPEQIGPRFEFAYILYNHLGKIIEAQAVFRAILTIKPDDALTHYWLGHLEFTQGNHPAAVRESARAVELAPDNLDFLTLWGDCTFASGDYATAKIAYQKILALKPEDSHAKEQLSRIAVYLGANP